MEWTVNGRITLLRKELKLSQTEFGKRIGVSRGVIKNIDDKNVQAKPLLIDQICKEYNVNREWLVEGEGEMFIESTRDEQIIEFVSKALVGEDDTFKKRLITALIDMTVEEWEALEKLINRLAQSQEQQK